MNNSSTPQIAPEKSLTYCELRLQEMGIPSEYNQITAYDIDYPPSQISIFSADENDNIVISYLTPNGEFMKYEKNKKLYAYQRKRIKQPKDRKYTQPYKSGVFPFITPIIIDKFNKKQDIDTLLITEGELKAFAGSYQGLDIIGIGGILSYTDRTKNDLDKYIKQTIVERNVKNVVLLFDADCLTVLFKPNEPEKDLFKRPYSFYTAVKKFKEFTKPLNVNVFFAHIKEEFQTTAKGLDDLLQHHETDIDKLKTELLSFGVGQNHRYISFVNINEISFNKLQEYFGINNHKEFYIKYRDVLQDFEYTYSRHRYKYDDELTEPKIIRHGDANFYVRVGDDYFKRIVIYNHRKEAIEKIEKWKKGEINQDYCKKGFPDFFDQINKYDGFCNIPDNSEKYQREHIAVKQLLVSPNFNLYEPLEHTIEEGDFPTIISLLQHLTNYENTECKDILGNKFTILLDYITILYQKPAQKLPAIGIVSKQNATGKTTLLNLLKMIFQSNAVILDEELFNMQFNAHYIHKLLIMLDEVKIEHQKDKRRIKNMTTGKTTYVQFKGVDVKEVDNIAKLIMVGNDERDMLPLEAEDVRFFILKVYPFEKEDPDFEDKLKDEIPAFLYFLKNRKIFHPKETRAWFKYDYLVTEQMKKMVEFSKSPLEKDLTEFIIDYMTTFNVSEFQIDLKRLKQKLDEDSGYKKHDKSKLREFLQDIKGLHTSKSADRFTIYNEINPDTAQISEQHYVGKVYTFTAKDWMQEAQYTEFISDNN